MTPFSLLAFLLATVYWLLTTDFWLPIPNPRFRHPIDKPRTLPRQVVDEIAHSCIPTPAHFFPRDPIQPVLLHAVTRLGPAEPALARELQKVAPTLL